MQQIRIKLIILVKFKKQKLIITKRNKKKIVRMKPTVGFGREDIKIESNIMNDMN